MKLLTKIICGTIAVLTIITMCSCGNKGYKNVAEDFIEALLEGDAKKMVSLMSEDLIDDLIERSGCKTKKVLINTLEKSLKADLEAMKDNYGKKWKCEIECVDTYREDDICTVILDVTYKGKSWFNSKEDTSTIEVVLVKDDGKWRVDEFPNI